MRRIVVYSAVKALIVVMALCLSSDPVWAQQCRRSCNADEERDARGCCIPGKTEQQKKKEQEQKAEQERRARKERDKAAAEKRKKAAAERRKKEQEERAARDERERKQEDRAGDEASQTQGDNKKDTQALEGTGRGTKDPAVKSRDRGKKGDVKGVVKGVDRQTSESSSPAELDASLSVPETEEGPLTRRWATWIPWSVVGAGTALFVTGGVLEWRAVANGNGFDRAFSQLCGTIGCFESESVELNKRLETAELQQRLGIAFFITGGATIVTGLALAYLNRPTHATGATAATEATEEAGESSPDVSLVPMVSPGATGMAVHIRF